VNSTGTISAVSVDGFRTTAEAGYRGKLLTRAREHKPPFSVSGTCTTRLGEGKAGRKGALVVRWCSFGVPKPKKKKAGRRKNREKPHDLGVHFKVWKI